jgi:hypothetical protein
MESERAATHDEIWDDSALVDSWNQALDEYKVSGSKFRNRGRYASPPAQGLPLTPSQKYHSIHAKGGTVDDIPNGADEK